ncbi:unnamed protein product [Amaranthus hypochondriacus]
MGKQLNLVMFPWFAIGHITPFLHLANKLAQNGHKTILLVPTKAKIHLDTLNYHPSLVTLQPILVPHVEPLPPGTDTASDIPIHLHTHLATALDLTRPQVESIITGLDPKPDLLFYDLAYWIPDIASKFKIKTVCYKVLSAASQAIAFVPALKLPMDRPLSETDLAHPPLGYPSSNVVFRGYETKSLLFVGFEFGSGMKFYDRVMAALTDCDVIAIRTCREIEADFCDYISNQYNKPVFLTGPILSEPEPNRNSLNPNLADWLHTFDDKSVIFCAFGSQFIFEKDQFQELVLGFELTKKPFLVALKPPTGCSTIEEALPNGFKERVRNRGKIVGDWVQQTLILGHPSIGCFVSHCGFGSMWEGLMAKCQIVMVPQLGDQILNTRLMANEIEVGVEVERGENGWVSKENLCKAIELVMEDNEVSFRVRKNHAKWRDVMISERFMKDYVDNFVKDLENLVG